VPRSTSITNHKPTFTIRRWRRIQSYSALRKAPFPHNIMKTFHSGFYIYTYIYIYIYTHTYIHTYTHTHTSPNKYCLYFVHDNSIYKTSGSCKVQTCTLTITLKSISCKLQPLPSFTIPPTTIWSYNQNCLLKISIQTTIRKVIKSSFQTTFLYFVKANLFIFYNRKSIYVNLSQPAAGCTFHPNHILLTIPISRWG